ncbi:MAG: hypothetical protein Q4A44_02170 [Bacteroidales bacterium]|nr:hypothetical protein [Bacteroidales bacterium]
MTTIIMREMSAATPLSAGKRYPDFKHRGRATLDTIAQQVADTCALSTHDVKACLSALSEVVGRELGRGHTVSLGELGSLRARVQCAAIESEGAQHNASGFEVGRITFAPSRPLLIAANTSFHQVAKRQRGVVVPSTRHMSASARLALLQTYLRKHATISVATYAALTHLSLSTALRELRHWQDTPNNRIGYTLIGGRRYTIWQAD